LLNEFLLLATAHIFAVASPGADFAVVIKNALKAGKAIGVSTAVGVGLGILVHMGYTLFGLSVLLAKSEWLFSAIRYLGAAYLLWLAFKSFQSRKDSHRLIKNQSQTKIRRLDALKQGFFVNVLNPKVTLFFVALFTNIVSPSTPLFVQVGYGLWLSVYTMLWFAFVAWAFSTPRVLMWYQGHGYYVDWGMGVVLSLIAIRLVF
jgi:threonine efflux protein